MNRNANSYYVNSNLVDLEGPNLLTSSQSVQRIALAPTDSLSNSNDILASKTPQLQGVTLTPTIYIPNFSQDTSTLNVNETPIISKSANLSCISNSTKSQNLNRHENEQTNTETENLRAELIALKSFVVDHIYMVKKRSNDKDDELLIKNLLDQIEFLKQELKSKDTIIKMILENYRQNTDYKPVINIYFNDIFLFPDNGCLSNYADDATLYSIGENHNTNRNILVKSFLSLQKWFYDNYMVLNQGKCCYMSFGSNPDKSDLILEDSTKIPSAEE